MPLELWFDFSSSYSYLAVERAPAAAAAAGVRLVLCPFLLGPVFRAATGGAEVPFFQNPVRSRYMWLDVAREAAKLGLPFRRPSLFPQTSLLASRVALVLDDADVERFGRAVFRAQFGEDRDIASEETIGGVLGGLGLDAAATMARAVAPENKARLRAATEEAILRGIFGAPTFFAGGEMYFGNERLADAIERARRDPS